MTKVQIKCSGCCKIVDGERGDGFTAGFYDVAKGFWKNFARPGEKRLCDHCMWSRPEWQFVYGVFEGIEDYRETPRGRLVAAKMKALLKDQKDALNPVEPNATAQIFGRGVNTPVRIELPDEPKQ